MALAVVQKTPGSSGVSPFVATLVGAVVGGVVSLTTTLLVERQRHKHAAAADERTRLASAYMAARIVLVELRDAESLVSVTIEREPFRWPPRPDVQFSDEAWTAHSEKLAGELPQADWEIIALPYSSFSYVNLLGHFSEAAARTTLGETREAIRRLVAWSTNAAERLSKK